MQPSTWPGSVDRHQGTATQRGKSSCDLLPNYFKTLGESPVRGKSPGQGSGIEPLTSQSTVTEHHHPATVAGLSLSCYVIYAKLL